MIGFYQVGNDNWFRWWNLIYTNIFACWNQPKSHLERLENKIEENKKLKTGRSEAIYILRGFFFTTLSICF